MKSLSIMLAAFASLALAADSPSPADSMYSPTPEELKQEGVIFCKEHPEYEVQKCPYDFDWLHRAIPFNEQFIRGQDNTKYWEEVKKKMLENFRIVSNVFIPIAKGYTVTNIKDQAAQLAKEGEEQRAKDEGEQRAKNKGEQPTQDQGKQPTQKPKESVSK